VCEQLAQSCYVERSGRDSNLRPLGCKFDAVTTTPPRHTISDGQLGKVITYLVTYDTSVDAVLVVRNALRCHSTDDKVTTIVLPSC